jgi:glutamine---fructose-6-phosphate transaminase (isomerizing)
MKHGPIALVDRQMPVVAIVPRGSTYEKMTSNVEEIRARDGLVIALEWLQPLLMAVPLQLLAYHVRVLRGCDVDSPGTSPRA